MLLVPDMSTEPAPFYLQVLSGVEECSQTCFTKEMKAVRSICTPVTSYLYCTTEQARRLKSVIIKKCAVSNFVSVWRKDVLVCWQSEGTG